MPKTALVTDSSACLPPEVADRLGVSVVPIVIHLPDRDLSDAVPEAPRLVYEALEAGTPLKSSAPTAAEYLGAIEGTDAEDVLVVTPAAEFTGMRRSASLAAELAGRPVAVVDCRTAAAAQGLVVQVAAEAAGRGASLEEVVGIAEHASRRAELVAALETLEHIARSGRVSPLALGFARRLGIRPVFRFGDGEAVRVGVPRSDEAALRRVHAEWSARGGRAAERVTVFHARAAERAARLAGTLGMSGPAVEFSPSMGIHTGPGLVGVAWLRSR